MSRKIIIDKCQGNTHYSVSIIDSYDTEHHLGYIAGSKIDDLTTQICGEEQDILSQAEEIWNNEVKPKPDLLANAIKECKEIDSINPNLREI